MNILEYSKNGFEGRFIIYKYNENTNYKKIKNKTRGQKVLYDNIQNNFIKYKNIIENTHKSDILQSVKGYDVEKDGSYKCKLIKGYRLDKVGNLSLKQDKLHKIKVAIEKLKTKLNNNVNKLSGDWALHNLIYSIEDDKIYNIDLEGFFSYTRLPGWGNIKNINEWLNNCLKKIEYVLNKNSSCEDLELINYYRPAEIHTIIAWDSKNKNLVDTYLKNLPINIEILDKSVITLSKKEQDNLALSIYTTKNNNRVVNNAIYLIVVKDASPIYSLEKATSCWQILNKNMKKIKEEMRLMIGGSKNSYRSIHTSYNQEEALFVLKPLKYDHYVKRITFNNFKQFFDHLNKHSKLKYLVQRSFHEIEYSHEYFNEKNDIDILVNDYYYFKALTGARGVNRKNMRENDNGWNIQSRINIGGVEIKFDIRFVGDDYFDSNWELDMLNKRICKTLKENIIINIPNNLDELYSLIYHIIIQKHNSHKSKHITRVKELLKICNISDVLNFNNSRNIRRFLDTFMNKNNYKYKKPYDKNVGFII